MNSLESKVTSLILSRKLAAAFKEKGIKPPESEFKWIKVKIEGANFVLRVHDHGWDGAEEYPAYLSDELLEGMPDHIKTDTVAGHLWVRPFWLKKPKQPVIKQWQVSYSRPIEHFEVNKSLLEASGEMTIWLIDNDYYE